MDSQNWLWKWGGIGLILFTLGKALNASSLDEFIADIAYNLNKNIVWGVPHPVARGRPLAYTRGGVATPETNQTRPVLPFGQNTPKPAPNSGEEEEIKAVWTREASPKILYQYLKEVLREYNLCIKKLDENNLLIVHCKTPPIQWKWIPLQNDPTKIANRLQQIGVKAQPVGRGVRVPKESIKWVKKMDYPRKSFRVIALIAETTLNKLKDFGGLLETKNIYGNNKEIVVENLSLPIFKRLWIGLLNDKSSTEIVSTPYLYLLEGETAEMWEGGKFRYADKNITITKPGDMASITETTYKEEELGLQFKLKGEFWTPRRGMKIQLLLRDKKLISLNPVQIGERRVETTLWLRPGRPLVLVGLNKNITTKRITGIPVLKDIPVIGWLFKRDYAQKERRVIITLLYAVEVK
jgi:hypothetical protein